MSTFEPGDFGRWIRDIVMGTERRIGLWLLPLFLVTAALGATLAGGLAVLYYSQQVADLREGTAGSRGQFNEVVEQVEERVEVATATIDEQVQRVRDQLANEVPVNDLGELGIYAAQTNFPNGEVRVASAFVVFSDSSETFLVTSAALVRLEDGRGVQNADLLLPSGRVGAAVHSVDDALGLAVLRSTGGSLPIPPWRPVDEDLGVGAVIHLAGIAGPDLGTVASGRVAGFSADALVTSVPVNSFVAGGPYLDSEGRVVAVASLGFAPFGPFEGGLRYGVPVRRLCDQLLRCTAADFGGDATRRPSPALRAPGGTTREGRPPPPTPEPSPQSTAEPTPQPTSEPSPTPTSTP